MGATDDILGHIPMDQLAAEVGASPAATRAAAAEVIQTLVQGMSANAADSSGERSLAAALSDHADADALDGGARLAEIDTTDGQAIVQHIFGDRTDAVIQTLGKASPSGTPSLVSKLLPILAPLVLAYLARRLTSSNSPLGGILGQILAGSGGLSLPDVLGQIIGSGSSRSAPAPAPREQPRTPAPAPDPASTDDGPFAPIPPGADAPAGPTIDVAEPSAAPRHGSADAQGPLGDDILGDLLGGLLGHGRRG